MLNGELMPQRNIRNGTDLTAKSRTQTESRTREERGHPGSQCCPVKHSVDGDGGQSRCPFYQEIHHSEESSKVEKCVCKPVSRAGSCVESIRLW